MASPLILTLLAKHHLVERDPIGSPDFLHHEGRQDVDFDSVCVKKSPPRFFQFNPSKYSAERFYFLVCCRMSIQHVLGASEQSTKECEEIKSGSHCNIKMISTLNLFSSPYLFVCQNHVSTKFSRKLIAFHDQAISELPLASFSKRVLLFILSYD